MRQEGGNQSVRMFDLQDQLRSRLYILNTMGRKLLQVAVRNEKSQHHGINCAQLKIIPYGLRKAQIWKNQPSDPTVIRLSSAFEYELTYHGSGTRDQAPKIHVIKKRSDQKEYTTLLDMTLPLSQDLFRLVPLFSFNPGFSKNQPANDPVQKKAHVFQISESNSVKLDFFLTGADSELQLVFNTHHGLSMFFGLDYLCSKKKGILIPVKIAMPISGFKMGDYRIRAIAPSCHNT